MCTCFCLRTHFPSVRHVFMPASRLLHVIIHSVCVCVCVYLANRQKLIMSCPPGASLLGILHYRIAEKERVKNETNFRRELLFQPPASHGCIFFPPQFLLSTFVSLNPSHIFCLSLALRLHLFLPHCLLLQLKFLLSVDL